MVRMRLSNPRASVFSTPWKGRVVRNKARLEVEGLERRELPAASLVSINLSGTDSANAGASTPVRPTRDAHFVSADGTKVIFISSAVDLTKVTGGFNSGAGGDVYLRDLTTNTTRLVSRTTNPNQGAGTTGDALISADGKWVYFASAASNVDVAGGYTDSNSTADVFAFSVADGSITLVSHVDGAATSTSASNATDDVVTDTSTDGRFVVYQSQAKDLAPSQSDVGGTTDVFLWDRTSKVPANNNRLVSHSTAGKNTSASGAAGDDSTNAVISADGNWVAYQSAAKTTQFNSNFTDPNGGGANSQDILLFSVASTDPTTDTTLVSHTPNGTATAGKGSSTNPTISGDGRFVAFQSTATANVLITNGNDTNGAADVYLFDRNNSKALALVSHTITSPANAGNAASQFPLLSKDGSRVAFVSLAANVGSVVDLNSLQDVFAYSTSGGAIVGVSVAADPNGKQTGDGASATQDPNGMGIDISDNGQFVTFESTSGNLVPGDTNGQSDVFVRDLTAGLTKVFSAGPTGVSDQSKGSGRVSASSDGTKVAFDTNATNLGPTDTNNNTDVYLATGVTGFTTSTSTTSSASTSSTGSTTSTPSGTGTGSTSGTSTATSPFADRNADVTSFVSLGTVSFKKMGSGKRFRAVYSLTNATNFSTGPLRLVLFVNRRRARLQGADGFLTPDAPFKTIPSLAPGQTLTISVNFVNTPAAGTRRPMVIASVLTPTT
jgi:WD40-like Beta Propeller Repeat